MAASETSARCFQACAFMIASNTLEIPRVKPAEISGCVRNRGIELRVKSHTVFLGECAIARNGDVTARNCGCDRASFGENKMGVRTSFIHQQSTHIDTDLASSVADQWGNELEFKPTVSLKTQEICL